ncbi:MAG: hypothetical protein L3K26_20575 [Candidatus Hydrogenedentes bacterium]|nr:hypothetical protein [Candidatus Hydrogenedentota bacterium]
MKHLKKITRTQPAPADGIQDFICFAATALNAFLTLIGGTLPATTFIGDKCIIPVANDTGGGDTTV